MGTHLEPHDLVRCVLRLSLPVTHSVGTQGLIRDILRELCVTTGDDSPSPNGSFGELDASDRLYPGQSPAV